MHPITRSCETPKIGLDQGALMLALRALDFRVLAWTGIMSAMARVTTLILAATTLQMVACSRYTSPATGLPSQQNWLKGSGGLTVRHALRFFRYDSGAESRSENTTRHGSGGGSQLVAAPTPVSWRPEWIGDGAKTLILRDPPLRRCLSGESRCGLRQRADPYDLDRKAIVLAVHNPIGGVCHYSPCLWFTMRDISPTPVGEPSRIIGQAERPLRLRPWRQCPRRGAR